MKVVFCIPTITRPFQVTLDSLAASLPLIESAGWDHYLVNEIGCPYVSSARATMLRKALDARADAVVFLDHDVSWRPQDLLALIEAKGDVVSGTYRFKKPEVEYMGALIPDVTNGNRPIAREDGALLAHSIPAGFLKITPACVNRFISAYPHLIYGDRFSPHVDLFNHGAHEGVWYGEDYAFARNWRDAGGQIWLLPDLDITHHTATEAFPGNFHQFLMRQPGGKLHDLHDPS